MAAKILLPICSFFILSGFSPSIASSSEDESDVPRTSSPMPETHSVKEVLLNSSKLGWEMTLRTFLMRHSKTIVTKKQLAGLRKFVQALPDEKAYGQVLSQLGLALTVGDLSRRNGQVLLLSDLMQQHYDKLMDRLNHEILFSHTRILRGIVDQATKASLARIGDSYVIEWPDGTPTELQERAMKSIEGLDLKSALQRILQVVLKDDQSKKEEQLELLEKISQQKDVENGLRLQEGAFKHLGLSFAAFYTADDLANTCMDQEYYVRKRKIPPFVSFLWSDDEYIGNILAESIALRNQDIMEDLCFIVNQSLDEQFQLATKGASSTDEEDCLVRPPISPVLRAIEPREMRESDIEELVEEPEDSDLEESQRRWFPAETL